MSAGGRACVSCKAELEPGQEYCLECGARQTPRVRPAWRRALIAAALTALVTVLVLLFGYERLRDQADEDAAASGAAGAAAVKQARASGPAAGIDSRRRAPQARFAARQSR
jgi:hypothetical protein